MTKRRSDTPCPRCGGERENAGQGYCRSCRAEYMRSWRNATGEHQRREAARSAARYLIAKGDLVRGPCEVCGTTENVEAHHDDYDKVAEVRWLCVEHHADEPKDRLLAVARET